MDFMTKNVFSCSQNQTVKEAATLMSEKGFSVVPIVDDKEKLVGIVTESDFIGKDIDIPHAVVSIKRVLGENHYHGDIEAIYTRAAKRKLSEVMTKNPIVVEPQSSLSFVFGKMANKDLKRLPVVENEKIVGIITRKDIIKAFNKVIGNQE